MHSLGPVAAAVGQRDMYLEWYGGETIHNMNTATVQISLKAHSKVQNSKVNSALKKTSVKGIIVW